MAWDMQQLQRASILTVEPQVPFVTKLHDELEKRHIHTNVEVIRDESFLFSGHDADDLIALDIPSILNANSQSILKTVPRLIFSHAIFKHKVFVSDDESAKLLMQNLRDNLIEEALSAQLTLRALRLAAKFSDLEAITQEWAESFRQLGSHASPEFLRLDLQLEEQLRYGENPHQTDAGLYLLRGDNRPGVAKARQIQGKKLSYNNLGDADAAYECVAEFDPHRTAACVIVKHANPCGVAEANSLAHAYEKALACDPVSAFGGIVAVNRTLDAEVATKIVKVFTEVIIAPDATPEAKAIVAEKKNLRLLLAEQLPDPRATGYLYRSVAGGILRQPRDIAVVDDMSLEVVTRRAPTPAEMDDLNFAFRVAKHVKSNTIVYAKGRATVGIGAGQMSRVDAARIAAQKARDAAEEAGLSEPLTKGSVVASDAFFPFPDGLEVAIEAGATAVIQPGGSVKDADVIKAADDRDVAMVFTGTRHFRH
jgi:phosphoribosylaminoimidazolecarboxamide formyltransferase/IMP cyclohydrolase